MKSLLKAYVVKMKDKPQIKGMNLFPFDGEENNKSRVLFSAHPCLPLVISLFFECQCSLLYWSARTYGERNYTYLSTPHQLLRIVIILPAVMSSGEFLLCGFVRFRWKLKLFLLLHCSLYFIQCMVVTVVRNHFTIGNILLIMKKNMKYYQFDLHHLEGKKQLMYLENSTKNTDDSRATWKHTRPWWVQLKE